MRRVASNSTTSRSSWRAWRTVVSVAVLAASVLAAACGGEGGGAAEVGAEPSPAAAEEAPDATATMGQEAVDATTQPAADAQAGGHFTGMTVEFVVPFGPGGGYDTYPRLLAPELSDCLGAEVIVVNEPGAGGLVATNQTWIAPPDGSRIQILNTIGVLGSYLGDASGVQYEPADFSWIGRVTGEPDLLVTAADGRFQSLQDMLGATPEDPVTFAATGTGSNAYLDALIVTEIFGVPGRIVTGFGGGEGIQAVLAGDVDAESRSLTSQLPHVENGEATPVLVMGSQEVESLPDTPTMLNVETDADVNRDVLEQHADLIESGRSLAGPPGMDPAALEELRTCYESIASDPESEFNTAAEAQGRPVQFMSGQELEELVHNVVLEPSPEYVEIVRGAYAQGS